MPTPLSSRERRALKARAHALEPVVQIGQGGLSVGVLRELEAALDTHELIKVRAALDDRHDRAALLGGICDRTGAEAVGSVGKILILWRQRPVDDTR